MKGQSHAFAVRRWAEEIRERLNLGALRFAAFGAPLSGAWNPTELNLRAADESPGKTQDLSAESPEGSLYREYWEEVYLLRQQFEDGILPSDVTETGAGGEPAAIAEAWAVLRAWERHAIPLRYRAGNVYRIYSPMRTASEPMVKGMPAEAFVAAVAVHTAAAAAEVGFLRSRLRRRTEYVVVLSMIVLFLLAKMIA